MKGPRVSITGLMFAGAVFAINLQVMRSAVSDPHRDFAFAILPMASLLMLVAVHSAPNLSRGDWLSPFVLGFEALGWAAVSAFITCNSIAPSAIREYDNAIIESPVYPLIRGSIEGASGWVQMFLFFALFTTIFSLPQVLLALLGGWLSRKAGLTVRFGRIRNIPSEPQNV